MTQAIIDVKIGCSGQEKQQLYSALKLKVELRKDKLIQISNQLCLITGTSQPPFLIIELPNLDYQEYFQQVCANEKFQFNQIIKGNKLYFWANFKNQKHKKLSKNIQKAFKKLTQLNSSLSVQAKFYNIKQSFQKSFNEDLQAKVFNGCQINAKAKLDKDFVQNLKALIEKVNPQFNNSPIATFLELFEYGNFTLNLQSIQDLQEEKIKELLNIFKFENKKNNLSAKLFESNENLKIYLNISKLFSVKGSGSAKLMSFLFNFI